uniref:Ig-like domain-containing protein n=1 Tax=Echeneis naucrates TaxID=173247 RepID=A0A665WCD8_ECHNA
YLSVWLSSLQTKPQHLIDTNLLNKCQRKHTFESALVNKGEALDCVATVHLGEPVTFKCALPSSEHSNTRVKWYKQSFGDTLRLITSLMKGTINPTFEEGFPHSRFHVDHTATTSALTIHSTVREDEALYHCAVTTWHMDQWNGTYLSLKGTSTNIFSLGI